MATTARKTTTPRKTAAKKPAAAKKPVGTFETVGTDLVVTTSAGPVALPLELSTRNLRRLVGFFKGGADLDEEAMLPAVDFLLNDVIPEKALKIFDPLPSSETMPYIYEYMGRLGESLGASLGESPSSSS